MPSPSSPGPPPAISHPEDVGASLRRLTSRGEQPGSRDLVPGLQQVVASYVDILGVSGSGIVLADDSGGIHHVASSNPGVRALQEAESGAGQGPCTDAYVDSRVVWASDLELETRWPQLRAALDPAAGVRAVLGVPVALGGTAVGTLDVVRDHPHEWSPAERDALLRFGGVVATVLSSALAVQSAGDKARHLQHALDYRVVIERGVGFLMARDGVDSVTAFDLLRSTARSSRTKIGRVAQHLLDTGSLDTGSLDPLAHGRPTDA